MDFLAEHFDAARREYSHGITAALGVGWATQAADLAGRLLGLVAIIVGILGSLDKMRRDRQLHALRMAQARERPNPELRVYSDWTGP